MAEFYDALPWHTGAMSKCKWCDGHFKYQNNLYRHMKTCARNPENQSSPSPTQPVVDVQQLLTALCGLLTQAATTSTTTTTTTGNNNASSSTSATDHSTAIDDHSTTQVTINNYGSETIGHVLDDHAFMRRCFKSMLSQGIPNLLKKIHFDDDHPENQNVRLRSIKRDLMEIFSEDRWKVVPGTQTTEQMIQKGCKLLGDFYDAIMRLEVIADAETADRDADYQRAMTKVMDRSGNEYYRLRRHTKTMILDETERRQQPPQ